MTVYGKHVARWLRANAVATVLSLTLVVMFLTPPACAQSGVPLASAAIDRSLYRDGEVRRLSGDFVAWTLVCDEVTRLHQRFCSLRSLVRDSAGNAVAALTVSTGDDGRPAALMRMPAGIGDHAIINIVVRGPSIAGMHSEQTMRLRPASCDAAWCTVVWSLKLPQIQALNAGNGFLVRYPAPVTPEDPMGFIFAGYNVARQATGEVSARGFAAAVDASVNGGR